MAILQALFALISKSAGKVLNAIFGWAVRALFGQTTTREQTFLSVVVGAAVAWPILLFGVVAPKIAALMIAFVPIPHWIPSWTVRTVWFGLALLIPIVVGLAVAAKSPALKQKESVLTRVLRGFPITVGLAAAFLIMFISVPLMRLVSLARRHKSADIPLATDAAAYHEVATKICEVLNRHDFAFRAAEPSWWVAAPTRILTWFGGEAFRSYVPTRLEYFVSKDLELSLYPSGLLLRGAAQQLTWAHGLIAEMVVHTDGLQTSDPKSQDLEKQLRRLWKVHDDNPKAHTNAPALLDRLGEITQNLGQLEIEFEDWQVIYRQILQVDRALRGLPQLMDREAPSVVGDQETVPMNSNSNSSIKRTSEPLPPRMTASSNASPAGSSGASHPSAGNPGTGNTTGNAATGHVPVADLTTVELVKGIASQVGSLARKELELAKIELKTDLRAEAKMVGGLGIAGVLLLLGVNVLLVAGVLALALIIPAWVAGLTVSGALLAVGGMIAMTSWRRRVSVPLERTRQTVTEDLQWAKERLT